MHVPVIVLHVTAFHTEQQLFHTRLAEEFDKGAHLRQGLVGTQKRNRTFVVLAFGYEFFRLIEITYRELPLCIVKFFDIRLVLHELLVVALRHRAGDNQRSTGIVDEHGIDLVDYGIMMLALYEVLKGNGHIVPEVVKTELIVGTERYISIVGSLAGLGIGLVLVDAIYGKPVEHVKRPHPFGVSFREIIVDCHHMHALSGQGVQENRKRSDKGFSFAGRHFRYFPLMQGDSADELHVIMHHVPHYGIPACRPRIFPHGLVPLDMHEILLGTEFPVEVRGFYTYLTVLGESSCRRFHYGECIRKDFVQHRFYCIVDVLLKGVRLACQLLLLCYGKFFFQLGLDFGNPFLVRLYRGRHTLPQLSARFTQFVHRKPVYPVIGRQHLFQYRLYGLQITLGLGAEQFLQNISKRHISSKL